MNALQENPLTRRCRCVNGIHYLNSLLLSTHGNTVYFFTMSTCQRCNVNGTARLGKEHNRCGTRRVAENIPEVQKVRRRKRESKRGQVRVSIRESSNQTTVTNTNTPNNNQQTNKQTNKQKRTKCQPFLVGQNFHPAPADRTQQLPPGGAADHQIVVQQAAAQTDSVP